MSDANSARDRQYTVINPELIEAKIHPDAADATKQCRCELREISRHHARILVAGPIQLQQDCQISIASRRLKQPMMLSAKLEWARPNAAGDWLLGCTIEPAIPTTEFLELVQSGLLERRSAARQSMQLAVEVQWQAGQPSVSGTICDISSGGLCLMSSACPENTRHFSIRGPESDARVYLKAQWWISVGPNYFIGCEFVRPSDVSILRDIQTEASSPSRSEFSACYASASAAT